MNPLSNPELKIDEICGHTSPLLYRGIRVTIIRYSKIHDNSRSWTIPLHTQPDFEFHYILSGKGRVCAGGEEFTVKKDNIFFTLPYIPHWQSSASDSIMEEYCIECQIDFPDGISDALPESAQLKDFLSAQGFGAACGKGHLLPMLKGLEEELSKKPAGSGIRSELLFIECILEFLHIFQSSHPASSNRQSLNHAQQTALKIKSFLDLNYKEPFTLEEMSHVFYLSSRQLNRIFLQCYHTTITAYLKNLRYNTALAYMEKGDMTLREIAAECGFTGYQQLRRMIQKQKGPETHMI